MFRNGNLDSIQDFIESSRGDVARAARPAVSRVFSTFVDGLRNLFSPCNGFEPTTRANSAPRRKDLFFAILCALAVS